MRERGERYARLLAKNRAARQRMRQRNRARGLTGEGKPLTLPARSAAMTLHPQGCVCFDCLWGHRDDRLPLVAKVGVA